MKEPSGFVQIYQEPTEILRKPINRHQIDGHRHHQKKKESWRTVHSYIRKGLVQISSALSWDGETKLTDLSWHHGKNEHSRIGRCEIANPPPLTKEDEMRRLENHLEELDHQRRWSNKLIPAIGACLRWKRGETIAECTSSTYKYKSYWDISREPTKTQQINAVNDYIDIKEIEDRI